MSIKASLKTMENQMGQLTLSMKENQPRSFQSDTENKPKKCKSITLRSGKELRDLKEVEKEKVEVENEEAKADKKEENEKEKFTLRIITFSDNPPLIVPPCHLHKDLERLS